MRRRDLLLSLASAGAMPRIAFAQPLRRRRALVTLQGVPADIPLTPWRTMPAVQGLVNGQGPFTLGVDTGYPALLTLGDRVAAACSLPIIGHDRASDPSGINPVAVNVYRLDELRVGGLVARNLEVLGGGAPPTAVGLDGIIGLDLFRDCVLQLDFPGKRLRAGLTSLPRPDDHSIFDFGNSGFIEIPVQIGGVTLRTMLDTGQVRSGLIVPRDDLKRLPVRGQPRSLGVAHTMSQAIDLFAVSLTAPVRLGALDLGLTEVAYPPPIPQANLGAMALQDLVVTLDQPRSRVAFSRP